MEHFSARCEEGCHRMGAFIARFFRFEYGYAKTQLDFGFNVGYDGDLKFLKAHLHFGPFQFAAGLHLG